MQLAILRDVAQDPSYRDRVRSLNRYLIDRISAAIAVETTPARSLVNERFGPTRFAEVAERIIASTGSSTVSSDESSVPAGVHSRSVESAMLATFADLQYQRLLYS